jgi:outer membrane lipoprotein-sorting protein
MGENRELTEGNEVDEIKNEAGVVSELNYIKNGYTLEIGGIEKVNDVEAYVLNISKGDTKTTSYFDKVTGLKIKTTTTVDTPMGAQQIIVEFSDYREVNGVKFPFVIKQNAGGMAMDITITSIEINKGLDDSVFK